MKSVVWAQFMKDKRNPLIFILFIVGSIFASLLFAGGLHSPTMIAIFSEEANASAIEEKWEGLLNQESGLRFEVVEPNEAHEGIRNGKYNVIVKLQEHDYKLIISGDYPLTSYINQSLSKVFQQEAYIHAIEATMGDADARQQIESFMTDAPFQLDVQGLDGELLPQYNMQIQLLFAFTFLISMFILGLKVNNVTQDKVSGLWNRMILSPINKPSMYFGYILYSFLITMFQVVVVLTIFKYVLNYELGDNLWLIILIAAFFIYGMISIAMLVTGFVRTPEQFYAIYPSFIPLIPLISGAYMMPGTITNPILTFIADLFPMAHAMEAIISVVFYNAGLQDILMSLLYMLLIGVIAMGIGINLIERRSK